MSRVVRLDRDAPLDQSGGKGRALARLTAAGFPVPPWLVVTPRAFDLSTSNEQRTALASASTAGEAELALAALQVSREVCGEIAQSLGEIGSHGALSVFAVRSSALEEDSARHSFAGQLQSFLYVAPQDIPARVVDVWRSGFSERVYAYCREHGLSGPAGVPAVVIQCMVDAEASGVAFSVDPVSGDRNRAVVGAVYGVGTSLVDGTADADTYYVGADREIIERKIAHKVVAHRRSARAEGVEAVAVTGARSRESVLDDARIRAVADLARSAERFFGRPQDIEWAMANGSVFLLQSRPITSLFDLPEPEGALNIWDNSNIAESYGGITTPLTFSFARNAYEGVYRQLCRTFGVPRARIEDNTALFANMLGLVRGQIYYNLLNWYRFLALLPGYKMNRGFMEQMMGVKESLREGLLDTNTAAPWAARLGDSVRFVGTVVGFGSQYFTLPGKMRAFYARLDRVLQIERGLDTLRADELVAHYRLLESRLLSRWDAPLINDFYTMIFYGVLRKLCGSWCCDGTGTLQNDLLCGSGGMVSTEPAERVREMADIARKDPALVELLCEGEVGEILARVESNGELRAHYESYLAKFGERCCDELKLESVTLHDDPLMLLRSVGNLARRGKGGGAVDAGAAWGDGDVRQRAERRVAAALASRPVRRLVFRWVLKNARVRVRGRENLRLARTRLFGRVRRIMVEIGRRFYERDLLQDPRDVFYLNLNEILGFVEGTATSTHLRELAAIRKAEFAAYTRMEPPAGRFDTRGMVYVGNRFRAASAPREALSGAQRSGIGCCPGRVTGRVRVVRDPRNAPVQQGEILVAERTDPSWIMLFPLAAGLLVERGSLLSHSAIVAREMGIPTIVSIEGVTGWLVDGEWVELDGTSGVVKKVSAPAIPAPVPERGV